MMGLDLQWIELMGWNMRTNWQITNERAGTLQNS